MNAKGPGGATAAEAEALGSQGETMTNRGERTAVFLFGVIFVTALLVLAILVPAPTAFQYTVFRIVLALAAAGVAAFIPGFVHLEMSGWLRAGGAMAVFAIVYFFSPARLVTELPAPAVGSELKLQTESVAVLGGSMRIFFTAWNRHPSAKLRVRDFELVELDRIRPLLACCTELRTELTLRLSAAPGSDPPSSPGPDNGAQAFIPPSTTFEISSLSSHAFVGTVEVPIVDRVWFGLEAHYSTVEGAELRAKSDKIYLAGNEEDVSSFGPAELDAILSSDTFLGDSTNPDVRLWFGSMKPMAESK